MIRNFAFALAIALLTSTIATAQTPVAPGRETIKALAVSHGEAVIALEIVHQVKMSRGGEMNESESKTETLATVIDPSGLVVTSLSRVDPGAFYAKYSGDEGSYVTEVKSLKFIMPDNREIAASVVLRDEDLDLAFLRPLEVQPTPFVAIDLKDSSVPTILDPIFNITRLGRIGRRAQAAMSGEVQAVVDRPRKFYVPSAEIVSSGSGVPVFSADGKVLGIIANHLFPGGQKALSSSDEATMPVIRPAEDVDEAAAQAPAKVVATPAAPADEAKAP